MDGYRSHHRTAAKAGLVRCLRLVGDEPLMPDRGLIEDIVDEIVDAALDEAAMRTKAAEAGEETGCTVDWQHVAKQCREALDGPDGMVTLHRGALSLALLAVERFTTTTGGASDE